MKLQNAAVMVDKMSKFSRSFISLNTLNQIVLKNKQRIQAKAFHRWAKQGSTGPNGSHSVEELERKLAQKEQEVSKMELMFKEYSNWRGKLEQIEGKMKADVEFWRGSCEKLQKENEKLQRENVKQATVISDKNRELANKETTIDRLKKEAQLYTVEE